MAVARGSVHSKRWSPPGPAGQPDVELGVADMDIPSPAFVREAIARRLAHPIFGYTRLLPTLPETIARWYGRHTGWHPDTDAMAVLPFGLKTTVRLLLENVVERDRPGVILTPVYDGLRRVTRTATAGLVEVPLVRDTDLSYHIDFDLLRASIAESGAGSLVLCSPHNPLGRVWTPAELRQLAGIAAEFDLFVVSDEVHSPLTHPGTRHHPWPLAAQHDKWALVSSVGKAFNVSGIAGSWLVCGRPGDRDAMLPALRAWGYHQGSLLGDLTMDACLGLGDDWLAERVSLVSRLMEYARTTLGREAPGIRHTAPLAGYLLWLDLRQVVPVRAHAAACAYVAEATGLRMVDGAKFDAAHEGFARLNLATSRPVLDDALERLGRLAGRGPL
jgi:cystathionine beta-lyase